MAEDRGRLSGNVMVVRVGIEFSYEVFGFM